MYTSRFAFLLVCCFHIAVFCTVAARGENPIIRDRFTSDPAALVVKDRVYLYTGHDEARPEDKRFVMKDWRCYSSQDMVTWEDHGAAMALSDFKWAVGDAWASQVVERDGKFYWYATVYHKTIKGFSIAVGVSDSPTRPFDDDGQAYLFWGNTRCRYVKLKPNMTETDGPIVNVELPFFTEAPWISKYNGKYYLSYGHRFPEQIAYATADKITGPYTFQKVILDLVPNSPTSHHSIIEFKSKWYFIYHTAALPGGGEHRRSVCVEEMFYEPDGSIRPIKMTKEGVSAKPPTTQPAAH